MALPHKLPLSPKKPLAPPLPMLCVGGRSGDGLLRKPNSLVVGLGGARDKQGCRVEMTLLPRLQVCFALILCFICFHNPRGRTLEAWHGGPNRETHRPSPGLGPVADRRRGSESFLGDQGRASEGVCRRIGGKWSCPPAPHLPCQTPGSLMAPPRTTPARQMDTYCQPWMQDS